MGEVIAPLAILAAVIYGFVSFAKMLRNGDTNGAKTQAVVWLGSIGGVYLVAESFFGTKIDVYGTPLADLDWATKLVVGLVPAALGIVGYDLKKAVDGSDTANSLPLFDKLPTGGTKSIEGLAVFDDPTLPADGGTEEDGHDAEDPRTP